MAFACQLGDADELSTGCGHAAVLFPLYFRILFAYLQGAS
jgi:hypothetical protein